MRKKILITGVSILLIIITSIIYLSVYGVKTDKFNRFINNKVKEYNSKLTLQTENVYIKLNLSESGIKINKIDIPVISIFLGIYFI